MDLLLGKKKTESAPAAPDSPVSSATTASFERDVIAASKDVPVIVDFWAPWCGPCKTLGPVLERNVMAAKGRVRMVKVNIDENPELAQALRIQSIPTVYAFFKGQPVDGFAGAVPDSQVKQFVERLAAQAGTPGADPIETLLAQAQEAIAAGQAQIAQDIYVEVLDAEPASVGARAGLARLMLDHGQADAARQLLDAAPAEVAKHAQFAAIRTALELAAQSAQSGETAPLLKRLEADPDDHAARFDLAMAYYGAGNREAAVDELLESIRRDRSFNDEEARKQLVKFFEAFGFNDPLTVSARKRLSALLFR
jgi:putative thioredoxin